jgi:hypothetical protein
LAGIAVLGWIRDPEKNPSSGRPVSATSSGPAESRVTFSPQSAGTGVADISGFRGEDPHTSHQAPETDLLVNSAQTGVEHKTRRAVPGDQQTSAVMKTPESPAADIGRHEDPQTVEDGVVTRSGKPSKERSEDREQDGRVPMPRVDRTDDTGAQTQPVVGKKNRSTAKSAAIIVGTAVAGAAIGAATGGGKGAAIGAISGGAGGYVYDGMTRHHGRTGLPTINAPSDADQQGDPQRYDRESSFARRFGTPSFN